MNRSKFNAEMAENKDTQATLSAAMGISLSRLNAKINERDGAEFTQNELAFFKARWSLSNERFAAIFFSNEVSK
ncbi:MAG: hypothetical protein PHT58_03800 [Eubacteriales bacterium]|nr:hypothetical protein [Eubacteriales bacterium]